MKIPQTLFWLFAFLTTIHALALPDFASASRDLFKRKGGGGRGGSGGSSSSSSSSSSSAGGSRGSGSSGTTSGSSSSGSRTSSSSSDGGSTRAGSGAPRAYGGASGGYYGGGAATPYKANGAARGGVSPVLLGVGAGALGAAVLFPGLWLYPVYAYNYGYPHTWHNNTANRNETGPVSCLCQQYSVCGCDDNNSTDYLTSVANNGTVARRLDNGTLVINGTLPNGTTAPGGTDDGVSAASGLKQIALEYSGLWIVVAGVVYTVSGL